MQNESKNENENGMVTERPKQISEIDKVTYQPWNVLNCINNIFQADE